MNAISGALLGLVLLSVPAIVNARATHPSTYVDEGVCPFECCTYREWTVERRTVLLSRPEPQAKVVGVLRKGDKATGLTGKVIIVKPGQIEVLRPHTSGSGVTYAPGDIVWVYTYYGEGNYLVSHRGKMFVEESPPDYQFPDMRNRCVHDAACWGREKTLPVSVWWVKVKTDKGVIGWSDKSTHFGNVDACG